MALGAPVVSLLSVLTVVMATTAAPVFYKDMYVARMTEEDENVPVYVLTVSAYDPSGDTDIWYSLQNPADHYFSIDPRTGAIEAIKPLDREELPRYLLVAVATNQGGLGDSSFADVAIELNDVNDNAPVFARGPYIGMVSEDSNVGTSVMQVMAEDPDDVNIPGNADIRYSIIQNALWNNTEEMFHIDPITSEISLMVDQLDREREPMYEIHVEARDGADHVAITTATIIVTDANDSPPMFSHHWYLADVMEHSEMGTPVYIVTADDMDTSPHLTFDIIDGNDNDTFAINSTHGNKAVITVQKFIDYENPWQPKMYNLTLQVSDGLHTDDSMLWIYVTDVNEHQPEFEDDEYHVSCSEDTAVGTSIGVVAATDADGDNLMYSIDPMSDPMGLFDIDQHNGTVSVAALLDREVMDHHNVTVVVTDQGQPQLSDSAFFFVAVDDVNDMAPMFAEDYRPSVLENTPPPVHVATISAVDGDTDSYGAPFNYTVDNSDNILDFFELEQFGNEANITTKVAFDREMQQFYHMPIIITDAYGLSATSTLTIEIGDQNEFAHTSGTKHATVYQLNGRGSRVIGHVYAPDPDTGGSKDYDIVSGSEYFEINSSTGAITIADKTPEGSYTIQVTVRDPDDTFPVQISHLMIDVIYIFDMDVRASASLRLSGVAPEALIRIPASGGNSMLHNLTESLAAVFAVHSDMVVVFSVSGGPMDTSDLRYFVRGYRPESLDTMVATHVETIESETGVSIAQVNINECLDEHVCGDHGSCTSMMQLDVDSDSSVDAGSASLSLSATITTTAECVCMSATCRPRSCEPNPCLNGGVCAATGASYRCDCPPGFSGPQCQDTGRSFQGDGYAWYESLVSCRESHTSVEFLTQSGSGLLLYNGPIASNPGEPSDHIALTLENGVVRLSIDLGSGAFHLHIPGSPRLDDGMWHRVDVHRSGKEVSLMIDYCVTSVIQEYPTYSNEDTSSCLATGTIPGDNELLNLNTVLQVGGVAEGEWFTYPSDINVDLTQSFDGCIRNIVQDNRVYDLGVPAMEMNTSPGCQLTDALCRQPNRQPLCVHGTCMADVQSASCVCDAGYHGDTCEETTPHYDFAEDSYVTYEMDDVSWLADRTSDYQIMFRTREDHGTIWRITSPVTRDGVEYIHIGLIAGHINVMYNIGDGEKRLVLSDIKVDDGDWHSLRLLRQRNLIMVHLDGGGDPCHVASSSASTFREFQVDADGLIIGAMVDLDMVVPGENFVGCLSDPRLNGMYVGLGDSVGGVVASPSAGVTENCTSDACTPGACDAPLLCNDLWREYDCTCAPGEEYMADSDTCVEIDDCADDPCLNGAACQDGTDSVVCHCPGEYWGELCQYYSLCSAHPCENNATCEDAVDDFHCICSPEFYGVQCENYDDCLSDPCQNGGSCTDADDSFVCDCPPGYRGDTCEETAPCEVNSCENGGTCNEIGDAFYCDCLPEFVGDRCEHDDLCAPEPCLNNANCSLTYGLFGPNGVVCDCQIGYRGEKCEEMDYCNPNPCQNEGKCLELDDGSGFVCECAWSYQGDSCEDFEYITVKLTVGVTLFAIVMVTVILVLALCCARRYQRKRSLKKDVNTDKNGGTELTLVGVTQKTTDNGMDSSIYKSGNEYEDAVINAEDDGVDNTTFVHVYDNAEEVKEKTEPEAIVEKMDPEKVDSEETDLGESREIDIENP